MIVRIEGTGSQTWGSFDLTRSYVRKVLAQSKQAEKYYFIGPSNGGSDGPAIAGGAWSLISRRLAEADNASIQLVGYSRGAAYCMYIAQLIADAGAGQRVSCLILFDAVAKQAEFPVPDTIPTSVHKCFHAYRDPAGGSRVGFENVGLAVKDPRLTTLTKKPFMASHGGVGGLWYDAKDDENTGNDYGLPSNSIMSQGVVGAGSSQAANTLRAMPATSAAGVYLRAAYPGAAGQQTNDRSQVNIPQQPIMATHQDRMGSDHVGRWMWDQLIDAGVLPGAASPTHNASPLDGKNCVPGSSYRVS